MMISKIYDKHEYDGKVEFFLGVNRDVSDSEFREYVFNRLIEERLSKRYGFREHEENVDEGFSNYLTVFKKAVFANDDLADICVQGTLHNNLKKLLFRFNPEICVGVADYDNIKIWVNGLIGLPPNVCKGMK